MDAIFGSLADDFNNLMEGKILNRNFLGKLVKNAGKKLELNGFTGACIQLKGDWEFLDQALRFPRWDNKESMCWLCKASNHGVDLLWTGEGWKTTLKSHEMLLISFQFYLTK